MNVQKFLRPLVRVHQTPVLQRSLFWNKMGASQSDLSNSAESEYVKKAIDSNCVVVFSKTTCGFCRMAKSTLDDVGASYTAIELNKQENGYKIQNVLEQMTGVSTVPQVFINGKFVGGGQETKRLYKTGQLLPLVQQCSGSAQAVDSN